MLKLLVAMACVAIIAFVGYFFWGEFDAYLEVRQAAEIERTVVEDMRCAKAETELAAAEAGRPVPYAEAKPVLEAVVRGCRTR